MPRVSSRVKSVSGSPTVKLAGLMTELKAKGQKVISFALGEPDFPTPSHIVNAAKKALDDGFTKYTGSAGIAELRQAVAERYAEDGSIEVGGENVIVSPAKHSIFIAVMALVEAGDEIIIPDPCWISYEPIVRLAGGVPVLVKADDEAGFELSPESVAEALTKKTKMMILNSPSNPAGSVYSRETMKGLCDLAVDHDLFIVSDEIYDRLIYDGRHYSPASFDGMPARTITVNGFSKTFSMTGWRVGWLVADKSLIPELSKIQEHTITCVTSFVQKAAVAALRGPATALNAMVEEFRYRRDLMARGLSGLGVFEFQIPNGAFYIFPKYSLGLDSQSFSEKLLEEAGVALTPGTAFGPSGEGHLRFSYATSREEIEEGLSKIKEVVEKMEKG